MAGSKHSRRREENTPQHPARAIQIPADPELIVQLRAGDPRALTILVDTYFEALVRFAFYLLGSLDWAQDVVQDVFVRVWEYPDAFAPTHSLKQYLYAAVRNHALNARKYEAVRSRHQEAVQAAAKGESSLAATPSPENAVLQEATIQAALRQLSDRRQEAVRLRIEQQLTHAEIGEILGVSTAAAERLVQRALEELREILRVSG